MKEFDKATINQIELSVQCVTYKYLGLFFKKFSVVVQNGKQFYLTHAELLSYFIISPVEL